MEEELPVGDSRHGLNGYSNYRCRCEICRKSNADYQRAWRRRDREIPEHVHGTQSGYTNYMCRCRRCRKAHAELAHLWVTSKKER